MCVSGSLCNLYNWRYKQLGNLPHVQLQPEFQAPNPGFTYDFQLINVEDYNGVGESEPNPYFYQVSSVIWRTHASQAFLSSLNHHKQMLFPKHLRNPHHYVPEIVLYIFGRNGRIFCLAKANFIARILVILNTNKLFKKYIYNLETTQKLCSVKYLLWVM